jgi:hypothetical protein
VFVCGRKARGGAEMITAGDKFYGVQSTGIVGTSATVQVVEVERITPKQVVLKHHFCGAFRYRLRFSPEEAEKFARSEQDAIDRYVEHQRKRLADAKVAFEKACEWATEMRAKGVE